MLLILFVNLCSSPIDFKKIFIYFSAGDSGYNQQNQLGNDMNEETAHSPNKSAFVNGTEVAYNNITISDKITIEHHIRVIPMVPVVDSHGSNINFKEELQRESLHVSGISCVFVF